MGATGMKRLHFRFGPFHLDPADQLILRDGKPLSLAPKAFDTLVYLAQHGKRLVTRDELIKAVWPNSFVEDGSLSVNISLLRRALGEMDNGEPYIETVPRKGYRFRPQVTVEAEPDELPPAALTEELPLYDVPKAAITVRSQTKFWPFLAILFALSSAAILYTIANRHRALPAFASMRISRLPTRGSISDAAISPDGKYLAYALNEPLGQSLWIRHIATPSEVRTVTAETGGHSNLTFSPDGEYLYFVRTSDNGDQSLYRVPLLGGDATRVMPGVTGPISLSPDGRQFAFIRMDPTRWEATVIVANIDGSNARQIETRRRPTYFSLRGLAWSADGRSIFCFAGNASDYDSNAFSLIRVRVTDGSESRVAKQSWAWAGPVMRSTENSLLFVASAQAEDALQIWKASLSQGSFSRITNDLSNYIRLSAAADGNTVAAVRAATSSDIWIAPANDIDRPVPITSSNIQGLHDLTWTPDGRILYSARGPDYLDLFVTGKNGRDLKQLTAGPGNKAESAVTRNGRYVLYQFHGKIWRMDPDGANQLQLTFGAHDVHPMPSADSAWVVYTSFDNWSPAMGGKPTLWTVPVAGGQPVQLTQLPTSLPQVSPDGKLIACAYFPGGDPRYSQRQIAVFKYASGPSLPEDRPIKIFDRDSSGNDPVYFSPDGKSLDYVVSNRRVGNIWQQALDGKAPVQLTHFIADELFDFEWSRDGGELALARGNAVNDLVLIRDFNSERD